MALWSCAPACLACRCLSSCFSCAQRCQSASNWCPSALEDCDDFPCILNIIFLRLILDKSLSSCHGGCDLRQVSLDQLISSCDLSSACITSSALFMSVCVISSAMNSDPSASASWSFAYFSAVSSSDCGLSSAVSSSDCRLSSSGSSLCSVIHLDPASAGRPTLGVCLGDCTVRRLCLRDVLLWHDLSRGTSPELCSPVKALIAALSGVAQPHRHRCCFSSREACRTAALVVSVWLKAASSFSFVFQALHVATCCRLLSFSVFTHCV